MKYVFCLAAFCALPATAETEADPLSCSGPQWSLDIASDRAKFSYRRKSDLNLMLETFAAGAQWPRALTFVGRGDSAIVILEDGAACRYADTPNSTISAQILTQRGELPVLLTGCCRP